MDIKYEDLGDKKETEIGQGNNIMNLNDLNSNQHSITYGGDKELGHRENGKWIKDGVDQGTAGNYTAIRSDSKPDPGYVMLHETMHMFGLTDRYHGNKPDDGFEHDFMATAGYVMSQTHFNNWGKYILSQVQAQQQKTQNQTQFVLRYRVDISTPTGPKFNK